MARDNLLNSAIVFRFTLFLIAVVPLSVYISGLKTQRTIYENTITSGVILYGLATAGFCLALYFGKKLRDTVGDFRKKFSTKLSFENLVSDTNVFGSMDDCGDGIFEVLMVFLVRILLSLVLAVLVWLAGELVLTLILTLFGILYVIFYRACRLVLKNVGHCKGNVFRSVRTASIYTIAYFSWFFVMAVIIHHFHILI